MPRPDEESRGIRRSEGLGTFGGVFTPSVLTILGLILFLRLGYVVGSAGLLRALGIFALATSISLITSSSLSAIATNRRVRSGGDYYLISRSLGVAYGGALGLLLFVAQAVSVGFYCLGLGEGLASIVPGAAEAFPTRAATAAAALLFMVTWLGADLATRFQYVIMTILGLALVSFFGGGLGAWSELRLAESLPPLPAGPGFWALFAIFFPAVTGFTQGVSMSGDLADPRRSLPRGTFLAVFVSTAVYVAAIFALAASVPRETLVGDYTAMRTVALVPALIDAGIIAATASSALSSFLGAPRILQALAADNVFPWLSFAARTHGESRNPRRAVLLTAAIALATIQARSLNVVAAMVAMFFLISYALLNYATFVEATARSPSFRPRFRFFHRHASLVGTLLAVGAMVAIDAVAALVAGTVLAAVYQYVRRTAVPASWRDSRRAYQFHRIKSALGQVGDEPEDPRDWQPHILAFTEGEERRERLLRFASWITGGTGIITAVQLVPGDASVETSREARELAENELREEIARHDLDAFPLAVGASDLRIAAAVLVQAWGVGPIRNNTVLLNWLDPDPLDTRPATAEMWFGRLLRTAIRLGRSAVVLHAERRSWEHLSGTPGEERRIDVWWGGDPSSRLALLFAYLMTRTEEWRDARIRLLAPPAANAESVRSNLEHRLREMRIEAEVRCIAEANAASLAASAGDATLVLLPLRVHGMGVCDPFDAPVGELLEHLPPAALVGAASDIRLVDEEPEPTAAPEKAEESPDAGEPADPAESVTKTSSAVVSAAAPRHCLRRSAMLFEVAMVTRRTVLKIAAGLGAVPVMPVFAGCGDRSAGAGGPDDLFEHGVASGDPLPDAVILWTRLSTGDGSAVTVEWEVARDPDFGSIAALGTALAETQRDHTVKVDAVGLEPGTTYYYRFHALGRTSPVGRTRTAAAAGAGNVRFAVVSCSSLAHGYFHAYRSLAQRDDLDAVIHLGDYIYEYGDGEYGDVRGYEPPHEIVALADYRLRYSQYRRDPDLQEIHRLHPFVVVWDDHESADNSWRDGAVNHQPGSEGSWAERRAAAERAYSEWMPIRDQADGRIFRAFGYGGLVDLIMLDTRIWGRDEQLANPSDPAVRDPARELLGVEQEAWFGEQLRASRARWRVIGQQVMMGPLKISGAPESQGGGQTLNPDQWDGYFAARRRFFELVRAESPQNLVVLTGDIHTSWAIELTDDPNDPASYDPATGAGAVGVEFVTTSVTSQGIDGVTNDLIPVFQGANPHIKWADLERRGYTVLDVTPERVQAAWFHFDRVDLPDAATESFARAFAVRSGETLLREEGTPAGAPVRASSLGVAADALQPQPPRPLDARRGAA